MKKYMPIICLLKMLLFFALFAASGCATPYKGGLLIERSGILVGLEVTLETPKSPAKGDITVRFHLKRRVPKDVTASLEYSTDGGMLFRPAAEAMRRIGLVSPPLISYPSILEKIEKEIHLDSAARSYEVKWGSAGDLVGLFYPFTNVLLRLNIATPNGQRIPVAITTPFTVDNCKPLEKSYAVDFKNTIELPAWLSYIPRVWTDEFMEIMQRQRIQYYELNKVRGLTLLLDRADNLPAIPTFGFIECRVPIAPANASTITLSTLFTQLPTLGEFCLLGMVQNGGEKTRKLEPGPATDDRFRLTWEEENISLYYRNGGGNWSAGKFTGYAGAKVKAAHANILAGTYFEIRFISEGGKWRLQFHAKDSKEILRSESVAWSNTYDNGTTYRCWWGRDGGAVSGFKISFDKFEYNLQAGKSGD